MRAALILIAWTSVAHADIDVSSMPACDHARAHCIGIQLHLAKVDGATPEWLTGQLEAANHEFEPLDVGFELAGVDDASNEHVADRKDRNALASQVGAKVIHVFITGALDNIDDPGPIRGVTWHAHDKKYIIVSTIALPRTLAHELGHFFGLPHSTYAISIMNKTSREEPPQDQRRFADEEIAAMKPALAHMLRDKVLLDRR